MIHPAIDQATGYRDYSKKDLTTLVQIAVLRQLDVPIKEIREILQNPKRWEEVLKAHHQKLSAGIRRMKKNPVILEKCLEEMQNKKKDISEMTEQLSRLYRYLEMDARMREGYMREQLQRIFPGLWGKTVAAHFAPFLEEPVDTAEKEAAWLDMVTFLDEAEELDVPEELTALIKALPEEQWEAAHGAYGNFVQDLMAATPEELEKYRKKIKEYWKRYLKETAEVRDNPETEPVHREAAKAKMKLMEQLCRMGYYERLVKNLAILSNDYRKYQETLHKLQSSMNLQYDEEGNIVPCR